MMKIYHNPRCAHSRAGLKYMEKKGYDLEIHKYLTEGITEAEIREIVAKTGKHPLELVRTQESLYKSEFRGKELSAEDWIRVLAAHPGLLQRPIVVNGDQAVVAFPPEEIEKIL
ncbi:MAG: arsenate reductase family protein [Bacteroidales bacterium]|nr:arsenate reductase family protein [Bacteroidales bacterium]